MRLGKENVLLEEEQEHQHGSVMKFWHRFIKVAVIEAAIAKATTASQQYYDNAVTEGHSRMHFYSMKYKYGGKGEGDRSVTMSRRAASVPVTAREKAHLPIPPHQSIYYFLSAYVTLGIVTATTIYKKFDKSLVILQYFRIRKSNRYHQYQEDRTDSTATVRCWLALWWSITASVDDLQADLKQPLKYFRYPSFLPSFLPFLLLTRQFTKNGNSSGGSSSSSNNSRKFLEIV
uniref:Uncharacterized protein n=1 Tax=Onchocerca volvulus TaxID=6282 RepID=A0A8R1TUI6_ONCVO